MENSIKETTRLLIQGTLSKDEADKILSNILDDKFSLNILLDKLNSQRSENKGGGMRPIDYNIDCVKTTIDLLFKK